MRKQTHYSFGAILALASAAIIGATMVGSLALIILLMLAIVAVICVGLSIYYEDE